MLNFFKKEYKTILIVFVLLGGLFTWFYLDEAQKPKPVDENVVYQCFEPSKTLTGYSLGEALDPKKLEGFVDIESHHDKRLKSFQSADKSTRLNFADAKLVSIEYYPAIDSPDYLKCKDDSERFQKTAKVSQENLDLGDSVLVRYEGLAVFYAPDPKAVGELELRPKVPTGWMMLSQEKP